MNIDRAPSHDTFSRVVRMTDVETPGENISTWISSNFPDVCERVCGCKVLYVDGKAVRTAAEKSAGQKPVYNMNAMYAVAHLKLTAFFYGLRKSYEKNDCIDKS